MTSEKLVVFQDELVFKRGWSLFMSFTNIDSTWRLTRLFSTMAEMKSLFVLLVPFVSFAHCEAGAAPIWEFLSKEEKIGRIMHEFNHLVMSYCSRTPMSDCTKQLIYSGLKNIDRLDLDRLDPHQKNAGELIWNEMVDRKHPMPLAVQKTSSSSFTSDHLLNDIQGHPSNPHVFIVPKPSRYNRYKRDSTQSLILRVLSTS